ncbi:MAG: hypothetical protein CL741_07665 [Chloroflexi bacterium]|nr:hypothetical protein [Chloroflexota bacterium]
MTAAISSGSDPSTIVWTDWFGTAPWLIALLVVVIGVIEIVARRRLRRAGDLSPRNGEKRDPQTGDRSDPMQSTGEKHDSRNV